MTIVQEQIIKLQLYFQELYVKITNTPDNNFLIIMISILVAVFLFRIMRQRFLIFTILTLPATFFHELSHFFISFITFGKPSNISIFPKKDKETGGWTLGYVSSSNSKWYNQSFIAIAPIILFPLAIVFLEYSLLETNIYYLIGQGYLLANLLEGMFPSKPDWELVFKKPIPIIILIILIANIFLA